MIKISKFNITRIFILVIISISFASESSLAISEKEVSDEYEKRLKQGNVPDNESLQPPEEAAGGTSYASDPPEGMNVEGNEEMGDFLESLGKQIYNLSCTGWGLKVHNKATNLIHQMVSNKSIYGCVSAPVMYMDTLAILKKIFPEIAFMPFEEGLVRTNLESDYTRSDGRSGCDTIPYFKQDSSEPDPKIEFGLCKDLYITHGKSYFNFDDGGGGGNAELPASGGPMMFGNVPSPAEEFKIWEVVKKGQAAISNPGAAMSNTVMNILNGVDQREEQYHDLYSLRDGDYDVFVDFKMLEFILALTGATGGGAGRPAKKAVNNVVIIPLSAMMMGDMYCATTFGPMGEVPIGCRFLEEPFPNDLFEKNIKCADFGECMKKARNHSLALPSYTAPFIHCITLYLNSMLESNSLEKSPMCCLDQYFNNKTNNESNKVSGFMLSNDESKYVSCDNYFSAGQISQLNSIRIYLSSFVRYLVTIYVIFFGFKLALSPSEHSAKDFAILVLKVVFVVYFATFGGENLSNGYSKYIYPAVLELSNISYNIMFNSIDTNLCKFSASDYSSAFTHFQMWDSLDCRLNHYFLISSTTNEEDSGLVDSIMSFGPSIIMAFGNVGVFILMLLFVFLLLMIIASLVQVIVVSLFFLSILSLLSPIYIPMILFSYTKSYFNAWVKQLISFGLQPLIMITFFTLMLSIFDYSLYKTCDFMEINYTVDENSKKDFYTILPEGSDAKEQCKSSFGWAFAPDKIIFEGGVIDDISIDNKSAIEDKYNNDTLIGVTRKAEDLFKYEIIAGLITGGGVSTGGFDNIVYELFRITLFAIIFFHFSGQISNLASDIASGASLGRVTSSTASMMQSSVSKIKSGYNKVKGNK